MLPVTRANLDNICCTCLVNIYHSKDTKQSAYDVKRERNLINMLKLTAYKDVLKNPLYTKYVKEYCRKVCDTCFHNIKMAFRFQERFIASTKKLKDFLENKSNTKDLKYCCRICLNLQNSINSNDKINAQYLKWTENFSSMEKVANELALVYGGLLPKQLCKNCVEEIQNIEELQLLSKCSLEHIASEINENDNVSQAHLKSLDNKVRNDKNKTTNDSKQVVAIRCYEGTLQEEHINVVSEYSRNDDNNINEANTNTSPGSLKSCSDKSSMVSNVSKNRTVFQSQKNADKSQTTNDTNETIVMKCEEEDTQYLEQTNMVLEDARSEENNFDVTNILDKENSIFSGGAIDSVQEDNNDSDFVINNIAESSMTDSNATDEDANIYKNLNIEVKPKIYEKSKEQKHQKKLEETESKITSRTCPICSKNFKQKLYLKRHISTVHEKQKPFQCTICQDTFSSSTARKVHELIHSGEFPFVCEWCQKGFRRSTLLKIHKERHTTLPELLCPICKRAQTTRDELEIHVKIHEKRFPCLTCGKTFKKSTERKYHQNAVHLNLRNFKCKFCEKSFKSCKVKTAHQKHVCKKNGERVPIECEFCGKSFKSRQGKVYHQKHACRKYIDQIKMS